MQHTKEKAEKFYRDMLNSLESHLRCGKLTEAEYNRFSQAILENLRSLSSKSSLDKEKVSND